VGLVATLVGARGERDGGVGSAIGQAGAHRPMVRTGLGGGL
jgi:hypothetical protein